MGLQAMPLELRMPEICDGGKKMLETNRIINGNVMDVLKTLEANSVDMMVTSPPYFNLRAYGTNPQIWDASPNCEHEWGTEKKVKVSIDGGTTRESITREGSYGCFCTKPGCRAWKGELGSEPEPQLFIKHLCDIMEHVKRVLKPTGSCWVNLGDTYDENKCLMQIPSRFSIEMCNRNWTLRNSVIWHKPNALPTSTKDRLTVDYEMMYFFTKNPKDYYFEQQFDAIDYPNEIVRKVCFEITNSVKALRTPDALYNGKEQENDSEISTNSTGVQQYLYTVRKITPEIMKKYMLNAEEQKFIKQWAQFGGNANGRNKRCVWTIPTESFSQSHFATFAEALVEPTINATCPMEVCKKCGKPRIKIVEKEIIHDRKNDREDANVRPFDNVQRPPNDWKPRDVIGIKYEQCTCNAGFEPGVVMDIFMGCFDGTTEVLTKEGWKFFKDVKNTDLICSLNPKNRQIEFVPFIRKISYLHNGEMYHVIGRSVDTLVTPNHKIYVQEIHGRNSPSLKKISDFDSYGFRFFGQGNNKSKNKIDMNLLKFIGFWNGDGYKITKSKTNRGFRLGFHLVKKRKVLYLEKLLKVLGIPYHKYHSKKYGYTFHLPGKTYLYDMLNGNAHTKRVPKFIFGLSIECIGAFIEGFMEADGCQNQMFSCNKKLLDDIQILLLFSSKSGNLIKNNKKISFIRGRKINPSNQFTLCVHKKDKTGFKLTQKNIKKIRKWKGMVYDVTLKKNHILYVRRNGKCCWSGNSGTTGSVARRMGRRWLGIELNPDYAKIALERINGFERKDWEAKRENKSLGAFLKKDDGW